MEEKDLQSGQTGIDVRDVSDVRDVPDAGLNGNPKKFAPEESAPEGPAAAAKFTEEPIPVFNMRAPEEPAAAVEETVLPPVEEAGPPTEAALPRPEIPRGPVSNFMRPGGIFEGYEISNHKEMPLFMRVFAASALLHLVIFAASMQLPTFVARTCDSTEFTQRLCDTIYIASLVKDREFIDMEVVDPTVIPEANIDPNDITYVSATTDFFYPEDYWNLRDEIEGRNTLAENLTPLEGLNGTVNDGGFYAPGIPNTGTSFTPSPPSTSSGGGLDITKKSKLPKRNASAFVDDSADPATDNAAAGNTTPKTNGNGREPKPPLAGNNTAQNGNGGTNPTTPGVNNGQNASIPEDKYNRVPLYGFRDYLVEWREKGGNSLYQQFQYAFTGTIDKDGKLEVKGTPQFNGDPKMQEFVQKAVGSFSDSGMLKLLTDLKSKSVRITVIQDGAKFNIRLESEQPNDRAARGLFNAINIALGLGKTLVARGVEEEADPINKQKEQATLELLSMAVPRQEGKVFVLDAGVNNEFVEKMYQTYKSDLEKNGKLQPTP